MQAEIECCRVVLGQGYTLFPGWCNPFLVRATPFCLKGVALTTNDTSVFLERHLCFAQTVLVFRSYGASVVGKQMVQISKIVLVISRNALFRQGTCCRNRYNQGFCLAKCIVGFHSDNPICSVGGTTRGCVDEAAVCRFASPAVHSLLPERLLI